MCPRGGRYPFYRKFQSSPGWYAGSYVGVLFPLPAELGMFQSSPGWYAGSYSSELGLAAPLTTCFNPLPVGMPGATAISLVEEGAGLPVSILSRLVCRELQPDNVALTLSALVSILSRLVCRELLSRARIKDGVMVFQSSPGWYAGSYHRNARIQSRVIGFQSSPGWYAGSYIRAGFV